MQIIAGGLCLAMIFYLLAFVVTFPFVAVFIGIYVYAVYQLNKHQSEMPMWCYTTLLMAGLLIVGCGTAVCFVLGA